MRIVKNLDDAQLIINEILNWKDRLFSKSWDFNGLRITNAGEGVSSNDYVTKNQLDSEIAKLPKKVIGLSVIIVTAPLTGGGAAGYMKFKDGVLIEQQQST